jgi:hypothetical protein
MSPHHVFQGQSQHENTPAFTLTQYHQRRQQEASFRGHCTAYSVTSVQPKQLELDGLVSRSVAQSSVTSVQHKQLEAEGLVSRSLALRTL